MPHARQSSRHRLSAALLGLALAAIAVPASALEIKLVEGGDPQMTTISLAGRVDTGDSLKVRAFFGKLPQDKPVLAHLQLNGGDRNQAMAIGRFFYQQRVRTAVPPGVTCGSPCALVLVGGRDQSGKHAYVKHSTGFIKFNGPALNYADREYTLADLDRVVDSSQKDTLAIAEYLKAVGANIGILKHYISVPVGSTSANLSNEDALDLGIPVFDDASGTLIPPTRAR